jgi:hypothetical protein
MLLISDNKAREIANKKEAKANDFITGDYKR